MHRTLGSPVVAEGLLVISDFSGLVQGLDAVAIKAQPLVVEAEDMQDAAELSDKNHFAKD